MKMMIFSMLTLSIMSAASVNAQVRIGGISDPKAGTVLDLNKDDGDDGTLTLGLPRVSALPETNLYKGQMVYLVTDNKVYVCDGSDWTAAVGATGPQGPKGETGEQGPAGATGPRGSGLLKDTRDGKMYRIQDFGTAGTWMVDNLAYAPETCSENTDYFTTYTGKQPGERGYYYSWQCATGLTIGTTAVTQGICPTGWHIPTASEFDLLHLQFSELLLGALPVSYPVSFPWGMLDGSAFAGAIFTNSSGWDGVGFWWLSDEVDLHQVHRLELKTKSIMPPALGRSVRCVKN
jgi:hypothetical protein